MRFKAVFFNDITVSLVLRQDPRAGAHNSEREGRPQGGRHGGYRASQGNYRPFGRPGTRRSGGPK